MSPLARPHIRTLMLAAAAVAVYLAGLVRGPVWLVIALVLTALLAPAALAVVYLVAKLAQAFRARSQRPYR